MIFTPSFPVRSDKSSHGKPPRTLRGMGRGGSAYRTQRPAGAVNRAFSARLILLAMNPGLSAWAGMRDAVGVETVGLRAFSTPLASKPSDFPSDFAFSRHHSREIRPDRKLRPPPPC